MEKIKRTRIEEIKELNVRILIVGSFLVRCETVTIPPETKIAETRLRNTPLTSEIVDGKVIK